MTQLRDQFFFSQLSGGVKVRFLQEIVFAYLKVVCSFSRLQLWELKSGLVFRATDPGIK